MFNPFGEFTLSKKRSGQAEHAPEMSVPGLEGVKPEITPNTVHPEIIDGILNRINEEEKAEKRREEEIERRKRIIH